MSQCRRALPVRHGQTVKHSSDTDIPAFLQYGVVSSRVVKCDLAVSTKKTRQQGKTMLCVFLKESVEWTHSISITMAEQQCEMMYQRLCIPTVGDGRTVVQCLENCYRETSMVAVPLYHLWCVQLDTNNNIHGLLALFT